MLRDMHGGVLYAAQDLVLQTCDNPTHRAPACGCLEHTLPTACAASVWKKILRSRHSAPICSIG